MCYCSGRKKMRKLQSLADCHFYSILYGKESASLNRRWSKLHSCSGSIGKTGLPLEGTGPRNSTRASNPRKSNQKGGIFHRLLKMEIYQWFKKKRSTRLTFVGQHKRGRPESSVAVRTGSFKNTWEQILWFQTTLSYFLKMWTNNWGGWVGKG